MTGTAASIDDNSTADSLTDQITTAGQTIYFAQGILETEQETIIATRNATINQVGLNQQRSISSTRIEFGAVIEAATGTTDPLSQTFTVQGTGSGDGRFITSADVFFSAKDETLPVIVEIRNVVNGKISRLSITTPLTGFIYDEIYCF